MSTSLFNKTFVISFAALSLVFLEVWLMNSYARPYSEAAFPWVNTAVHIADAILYGAVAGIAFFRPHSIKPSLLCILSVVTVALGIAASGVAALGNHTLFFALGSILIDIGRASASLIAAITLTALKPKQCALCITLALILSYVMTGIFTLLPFALGYALFALMPALYLGISFPNAKKLIESTAKKRIAVRDLSITEPQAFLPFSHKLFVAFFVFRVAFGFSMTFFFIEGASVSTALALIPLSLVAILIARAPHTSFIDSLYKISVVLILAGFLLTLSIQPRSTAFPGMLLSAGSDCFRILSFFALSQIGRRNQRGSLFVFAWGFAAINAGSLVGFSIGRLANHLFAINYELAMLLVSGIIFLFAVFNIVSLHEFSFEKTVQSIQDISPGKDSPTTSDEAETLVSKRCKVLTIEHGLTVRESEIMLYLAKGRSVPFIQENLVISHNTVRTHVKHIYQKLAIHSQQDLISIVETTPVKQG